jgi:KipI family sensor histidine kinase inhibitor
MARITAACDRALLVTFAETMEARAARAVRGLAASLARAPIAGIVDIHPAYASVLVTFDPLRIEPRRLEDEIALRLESSPEGPETPPRTIVVPVRYGGEEGPDLEEVARAIAMAPEEVVRLHMEATYDVAFLGFTPGFPYLAGLPAALATQRRDRPRRRVEAGSVAIAGVQAGIYPIASAGGWNVLGRTDLTLFDPGRDPVCLFAPGDRVRFVAEAAR